MEFITDYIDRRHPNSPKLPPEPAELDCLMNETTQSMADYLAAVYCVLNDIIQPAHLPADWRAI